MRDDWWTVTFCIEFECDAQGDTEEEAILAAQCELPSMCTVHTSKAERQIPKVANDQ